MEFASYLAGERWSDHPACTDATLAALAREVNDLTTDEGRARLTPLIHRVVGLTGDNPAFGMRIALRAARAALPVANMERQRALAVAIVSFDPELGTESRAAFAEAPDLEGWARSYLATSRLRPHESTHTAISVVHTAVTGIAQACIGDADDRLVALLAESIEDAEATTAREDDRYSGISSTISSGSRRPLSFSR
jgi:hypothetical protein